MTLDKKSFAFYISAIKQSLCYYKLDSEKAEAMSKKIVCYYFFIIFCQCQSQGLKAWKSFFRGQQVHFLARLCFVRCLLLPFFAFFFHYTQLFRGRHCAMAHLWRLLSEIRDKFKEKFYFF